LASFSKALYPSGVVAFRDQPPSLLQVALSKTYPNQTSWLSVACAVELQATMDLLSPEQLRRNFFMGRFVQAHLNGYVKPQCAAHVRGCGGLIATDLDLASSVHFAVDRLLLPMDLIADEVLTLIKVNNPAGDCMHKCKAGTVFGAKFLLIFINITLVPTSCLMCFFAGHCCNKHRRSGPTGTTLVALECLQA